MNEVLTPLQRFWRLLSLNTKEIYQIYGYAVLNGFVNLSLPLGIQSIISFIQTGQITFSWVLLVAFVLIGIAITGVLQVLQLRIVENIQHELYTRSAFEFAYRIPKLQLSKVDNVHVPEVVNRFFDTLTIQKGIPKILIDFSLAGFQIFFGLILLAFYSPYFILLGIALIFFIWLIIRLNGNKGLSYSLQESKMKYALAHWLEEIAENNKSFKFYSNREFHLHKADRLVKGYLQARESHFQVLLRQFKQFIGLKIFLAAGLLIAGSMLVFQARLNLGQFVAAEIIIIIIINSIEKIISVLDTIYDVLTGLEKIGIVTDVPLDEPEGTMNPFYDQGLEVRVNNLSFKFSADKLPILGIDKLHLDKNSVTILGGAAGNGKTTFLKILARVLTEYEGQVMFNDIPIDNFSSEFLQQNVGVVFSTNELFDGTVLENITLGDDVPEEKIYAMLRSINAADFVSQLPNGLHSEIDSAGRRIPKSIIQKLLLVRALVHNPKLLLLDQALSDVEIHEREEIIKFLVLKQEDVTIITTANDSLWRKYANQIIEL